MTPFGTEKYVADDYLFSEGNRTAIHLSDTLGSLETATALVTELVREMETYRKIVREMIRRDGTRIADPNEFHRGVVSLANKIGEHPDDIKAVVEPMLRELFEEMLKGRPSKRGRSWTTRKEDDV